MRTLESRQCVCKLPAHRVVCLHDSILPNGKTRHKVCCFFNKSLVKLHKQVFAIEHVLIGHKDPKEQASSTLG